MTSLFAIPLADVGRGVVPSDGAKLSFFGIGTSNKKKTFSNQAGTTPNENPVVADGNGVFPEIWLSGSYKVVLKTKNNKQIWEQDPVIEYTNTANSYLKHDTVAAMVADTALFVGASLVIKNYTATNKSGVLFFDIVAAGTGTDDGGQFIDLDNGLQAKQNLPAVRTVKLWGAEGDGAVDDTAAIQAAIDSMGTLPGQIHFPVGTYLVTSTITVGFRGQHLVGAGMDATTILFMPTADDVCFHCELDASEPGTILVRGSITDMAFFSTDNTYKKTAINLVDTDGYRLANVVVGGDVIVGSTGLWSSGTGGADPSIGIRTNGRQAGVFDYLYLAADICINISDNPNSTLDCDHYHFSNTFLLGGTGSNHPLWKVDDGVNIQSLTIDGFQPWVGGNNGFQYVDTTTVQASLQISISNVRWEGSTNAAGHLIDIQHNHGVNGVMIKNVYGAPNSNGVRFRKCLNLSISDTFIDNDSETALDIDETCTVVKLENFNHQSGSAFLTGNLVKVFDTGIFSQGGPSFSYWQDPAVITTAIFNTPVSGTKIVLPDTNVTVIGTSVTMQGFLTIHTNESVGATYWLAGPANNTIEINVSNASFFSDAKGTANRINIYHESGNYKIQNLRGAEITLRYLLVGGVN